MKYFMLLLIFLCSKVGNATEIGGFFAKDVCNDTKCYSALSQVENALGKQLGYEYSISRFESFSKAQAEKEAYKHIRASGAQEPVAAALFIYKVRQEKQIKIPIVKKKIYSTVSGSSISLEFRQYYNLNVKYEKNNRNDNNIYSIGMRWGI